MTALKYTSWAVVNKDFEGLTDVEGNHLSITNLVDKKITKLEQKLKISVAFGVKRRYVAVFFAFRVFPKTTFSSGHSLHIL